MGFWSKDEVLAAVVDARGPIFLAFALAGALLSALYMARVAFVVFFGQPRTSDEAHESARLITIPLVLLAIGSVVGCVLAFNWPGSYDGFGAFLLTDQDFLHHKEKFHIVPWLVALSIALAVSGVLLGWATYIRRSISHETVAQRSGPLYRLVLNKYYMDDLYQWVIDRIVLAFSSALAAFDRIVVNDTGVDGPAIMVRFSAFRARYVQSGRLYNYGLAMALGIVVLAAVWWIRTG